MARKKVNHEWERVRATENIPNKELAKANKATLENEIFLKSCEMAGVTPTKRQASKWNNKKGAAYKGRHKKS